MRWRDALVLAALATAGCSDPKETPDGGPDASVDGADASVCEPFCLDGGGPIDPFGDASLALRTRALFHGTCAGGPESGCHSEGAANLTLTLDPDGGDVINVLSTELPGLVRVKPFETDESYVFWKVSDDPRIDGGSMPLGAKLDPRIPALIGAWIDAGAP